MTLAWPARFDGEPDEDEILLEWLKNNYATLDVPERRQAARRLTEEFGYTIRGLADVLGVDYSLVYRLTVPDETLERWKRRGRKTVPRVYGTRILRFADEWQERAQSGLPAEEAVRLLGELRGLIPKPAG
jgi:hypothetical protein